MADPKREIEDKLIRSLSSDRYLWRTAVGISREAKEELDVVTTHLENSPKVLKSSQTNDNGQSLYALREKVEREVPLLKKIWFRAANTSY